MPDEKTIQQKITSYMLAEGIMIDTKVKERKEKLAADCPAALAQEKGAVTVDQKAYLTIMIMEGEKNLETPATKTEGAPSMPASTLSSEEISAITAGLNTNRVQRQLFSTDTVITELVTDKPAPSELIAPGTTGTVNAKSWEKLEEKWKDKVLEDDPSEGGIMSKTNFATLKAAAAAGTPVEVQIGAPSKRPVAVVVQVPSEQGDAKKTVRQDLHEFQNWVVMSTIGYVAATANTAGAKLRYIKPSKDKKDPTVFKPARSVLVFTNRANATFVPSCDVTAEVKADAACKSALAFKVDTGRKKADTVTPIYQTIRATVNAPVKMVKRKTEFVPCLGEVGRSKTAGDLLTPPTAAAMKAISQAQVAAIASLQSKVAAGDFDTITAYGEALKQFAPQGAPAAAASVGL